jgi:hypothetical protein
VFRPYERDDWKRAGLAKRRVEVAQRAFFKELDGRGKKWEPRLFSKAGAVENMHSTDI